MVAPRHVVPAFSRISLHKQSSVGAEESDDDLEYSASGSYEDARLSAAAQTDTALGSYDTDAVGSSGKGYQWHMDGDADPHTRDSIALPVHCFAPLYTEVAVEQSPAGPADAPAAATTAPSATDEAGPSALGTVSQDTFHREVQETMLRGIRQGISNDNLVLEINSLKLAEVREFSHCSESILRCILELCSPPHAGIQPASAALFPATAADVKTPAGKAELVKRLKGVLGRFTELLGRFVKDEDDEVCS